MNYSAIVLKCFSFVFQRLTYAIEWERMQQKVTENKKEMQQYRQQQQQQQQKKLEQC